MPRMIGSGLSRREREILDILATDKKVSASDVLAKMPDPPSYSAVRSILRILEEKGHIGHEEEGKRYLYYPTQPRRQAARNALRGVVQTFFGGSLEHAIKAFLSDADTQLSDAELTRMAQMIEAARSHSTESEEEAQ